MREIKFRGWNVHKKIMDHNVLIENGKILVIEYGEICGSYLNEDFIPMQYTGLKDKNGKEIYEGDILKAKIPVEIMDNNCHSLDSETVFCEVIYEKACFWVKGKTKEYPWVLNGDKTILHWLTEITAYDSHPTMIEVIGNIYGNPELLNRKEETL